MCWLSRITWPAVAAKLNLSVMAVAFVIFGLSMIFQASRWGATPAYHILLLIFPAPTWGILFLVSGAGMAVAVRHFEHRWAVITALTIAFTLTTGWALAFVVRYLTSGSTTPETWVSWAVFDFLLLRTAAAIDKPSPGPRDQREITDYRQAIDDALTAAAEDQKTVVLRTLVAASEKCRDAVSAACADYGRALGAVAPPGAMPPGAAALQAIREARNALLRAEEAYTRATGKPVPGAGES